jgi:molecular chaperone GrpE
MKDNKEKLQEEQVEELRESTKKAPKADKLQKEIEELAAEIEALKAEITEKDDKYLRMAAEYDNFRRRSREEKEGIWEAAMAETVAELLPIIDNIERATVFEGGDKVREGLEMIAKTTGGGFE